VRRDASVALTASTSPLPTIPGFPSLAISSRRTPRVCCTGPHGSPAAKRVNEIKPAAVHNRNDRGGFILNDAQIASIKTRLHLTPDQEQMWPAVEAALRNIAYTRARDARRHGAPANTQLAAANADGVDVRDLKSAAIPLIMSFNAEQKDEVRNIAHVMGLDQLASQF